MAYADRFSDAERRKYRGYSIASTMFGCITEQVIDSNTILILYLMMLGGSESFSMLSTVLTGLAAVFLLIPAAAIANRIGLRKSYSTAVFISILAFLAMSAAPFAGESAKYIVIAACFLFCLVQPLYATTWYPMLDTFLLPAERGSYFGFMRFSYMILNTALIFGFGLMMGEKPPIWIMQVIIGVSGLMMYGRKFCMDRMPVDPATEKTSFDMKSSLKISIRNGPLTGFSIYWCFLNMAVMPAFALAIIYMKTGLHLGVETIMTITSIGLVGRIVGFALVGRSMTKLGVKCFQVLIHTLFVITIAGFLFVLPGKSYNIALLSTLSFLNGFATAFLLCLGSTQTLALARPGNKVMAMSFCYTFSSLGTAAGRFGTSLVLGAGVLAASWTLCGVEFTKFHFLFLVYLVMTVFFYLLLILSPAVVPQHEDYYEP